MATLCTGHKVGKKVAEMFGITGPVKRLEIVFETKEVVHINVVRYAYAEEIDNMLTFMADEVKPVIIEKQE